MNVYQKLAKARAELKSKGLNQSGENRFAGYTYFELADFLPEITNIELEVGILSVVRYSTEKATLTVYNAEKPEEFIEFTTPMSTAELKGCHAIQNLGAVETYVRRYLYFSAYEIVEAETLDRTQSKPDELKANRQKEVGELRKEYYSELSDSEWVNLLKLYTAQLGKKISDMNETEYLDFCKKITKREL